MVTDGSLKDLARLPQLTLAGVSDRSALFREVAIR